jgi:hypothetical protein
MRKQAHEYIRRRKEEVMKSKADDNDNIHIATRI